MAKNIMHYILKQESPEIMLIIAIIGRFLTVFFHYFSKVFFAKVHGYTKKVVIDRWATM